MRYSEATVGRALVVRLEDGEVVHECIEEVARLEGISHAAVLLVGGADAGSVLVVGPATAGDRPVRPLEHVLDAVHEAAGVGTIFPDVEGRPRLHLHAAFGRGDQVRAGCIRRGVRTWALLEAVIVELSGSSAVRRHDAAMGFDVLEP